MNTSIYWPSSTGHIVGQHPNWWECFNSWYLLVVSPAKQSVACGYKLLVADIPKDMAGQCPVPSYPGMRDMGVLLLTHFLHVIVIIVNRNNRSNPYVSMFPKTVLPIKSFNSVLLGQTVPECTLCPK